MNTRPLAHVLVLLVFGFAPTAVEADGKEEGRAALEKARAFYSGAGAFRETLEATVELPGAHKQPRLWEYGVGPGGEAFMTLTSNGQGDLPHRGARRPHDRNPARPG